jgi:hypothetical protein
LQPVVAAGVQAAREYSLLGFARITSCEVRAGSCELRVATWGLCKLDRREAVAAVNVAELRVASCDLRVTSYEGAIAIG